MEADNLELLSGKDLIFGKIMYTETL